MGLKRKNPVKKIQQLAWNKRYRRKIKHNENGKKHQEEKENVYDISRDMVTSKAYSECKTLLMRTQTAHGYHQPCVCIICDCFIIGSEGICWLSHDEIKAKEMYLSAEYLESVVEKKFHLHFAINIR